MRNVLVTILAALLSLALSTGCAYEQKKVAKELKHPDAIDCATARGDLRLLNHDKADVAERIVEGITAIYPASLVVGLITGVEGTKYRVAIGEYNKDIDKRIAEIKSTCGIE